jgi:hypothetical protein
MSDRSHTVDRLAEDEQDVVGQPVAGVLEQVEEAPGGLAERQFAEDGQDSGAPAATVASPWLPAQHVRDKN